MKKYFDVTTTNHGVITVPEGPADAEIQYWADVLYDRLRLDEIQGCLMAFRQDVYERAYLSAIIDLGPLPDVSTEGTEGGTGSSSGSGEVQRLHGCSECPSFTFIYIHIFSLFIDINFDIL